MPTAADRHHRPAVGLRRGAARPDSRQGPGAAPASRTSGSTHTAHIVPQPPAREPRPRERRCAIPAERALLDGRAVIVKRLKPLPVEAVVRGYLIGSGWKDYQRTGAVCGIALPAGPAHGRRSCPSRSSRRRPRPPTAQHDENIGFDEVAQADRRGRAPRGARPAIALYSFARGTCARRAASSSPTRSSSSASTSDGAAHADRRGADAGLLALLAGRHLRGRASSPPSFDKQFVRDYLETLDWNKTAPGPQLPADVIRQTSEKYAEALRRLTA